MFHQWRMISFVPTQSRALTVDFVANGIFGAAVGFVLGGVCMCF
jgi:hypothetical protein